MSAAYPNRLRETREHMGLTKSAMAKRIGVDPSTYFTWESGRRPLSPNAKRRLLKAGIRPPVREPDDIGEPTTVVPVSVSMKDAMQLVMGLPEAKVPLAVAMLQRIEDEVDTSDLNFVVLARLEVLQRSVEQLLARTNGVPSTSPSTSAEAVTENPGD